MLLRAEETVGLPSAVGRCASCDVLLNVSGMLTDPGLIDRIPSRVYLDLDPAFNQLWHAVEGIDMRLAGHTHFVTVGRAIGCPDSQIPTCGVSWLPTFQPVVLEEWLATPGAPAAPWTTVGNWRGYGSIRHGGVFYGQKAHSLRRLMELPGRTPARLELALAIDTGEVNDLESLYRLGGITDPPSSPARRIDTASYRSRRTGHRQTYIESRCGCSGQAPVTSRQASGRRPGTGFSASCQSAKDWWPSASMRPSWARARDRDYATLPACREIAGAPRRRRARPVASRPVNPRRTHHWSAPHDASFPAVRETSRHRRSPDALVVPGGGDRTDSLCRQPSNAAELREGIERALTPFWRFRILG